jgi:hypothetical protein
MTVSIIIMDLVTDVMMELAKPLFWSAIYEHTLVALFVASQVNVFPTQLNATLKMDARLNCPTAVSIMAFVWSLALTATTQPKS